MASNLSDILVTLCPFLNIPATQISQVILVKSSIFYYFSSASKVWKYIMHCQMLWDDPLNVINDTIFF